MLTKKENFLQTIALNGAPDRLVNEFTPFVPVMCDPVYRFARGNRVKGTTSKDCFGTVIAWPEDQFAAMPHVTNENKVCPDVTRWREFVKIPDLAALCSAPELWEDAFKVVEGVDRNEQMVLGFMGTGIFEQLHFLMGFEDTLMNFLVEPEAMEELIAAIADYRFAYIKLLVDNLKPDIICSHDDWGSKNSLFMSPEVWREMIKPHYERIYGYAHDHGVLILHHADSFLEPIVEDLADIHIDVWQGVLPTNDIVSMQKKLGGKVTLMGGIDSVVDRADATEDEIRAETRRVCETYGPGGHFIPSLSYGLSGSIYPHVDPIIQDEIEKYNKETYGI